MDHPDSVIRAGHRVDETTEAFLGMLRVTKRHLDRRQRQVASPQNFFSQYGEAGAVDAHTPDPPRGLVEGGCYARSVSDLLRSGRTRSHPLLLRQARQWNETSPQQLAMPLRCWLI